MRLFPFVFFLLAAPAAFPTVRIVKADGGFRLLRDGKPYFIKGAGGSDIASVASAGGNSIRTWGGVPPLNEAQGAGLTVLVGLDVARPRHGFDYTDSERVAGQKERIRQAVLRYKDHPAVLMWALGNEVELAISEAVRLRVWRALDELAQVVHRADPGHPVIIVLSGGGPAKLKEVEQHCPSIDAIGINIYGGIMRLPDAIASSGWKKPYIVTEFGPRGHWEAPKTSWGLPVEDSSTDKADRYLKGYRQAVEGQPSCLGSYVFIWGQKQEKTHTWYGMFLPDGKPLGAVDAMTFAWTGNWPDNRAPRVGAGGIAVDGVSGPRVVAPRAGLRCTVDVSDPDGDPIEVRWDLRLDVSDNPSRGGDREPPTPPIDGAIVAARERGAFVQMPDKPGNYRLFVYVFDRRGAAATANLPLRIE